MVDIEGQVQNANSVPVPETLPVMNFCEFCQTLKNNGSQPFKGILNKFLPPEFSAERVGAETDRQKQE